MYVSRYLCAFTGSVLSLAVVLALSTPAAAQGTTPVPNNNAAVVQMLDQMVALFPQLNNPDGYNHLQNAMDQMLYTFPNDPNNPHYQQPAWLTQATTPPAAAPARTWTPQTAQSTTPFSPYTNQSAPARTWTPQTSQLTTPVNPYTSQVPGTYPNQANLLAKQRKEAHALAKAQRDMQAAQKSWQANQALLRSQASPYALAQPTYNRAMQPSAYTNPYLRPAYSQAAGTNPAAAPQVQQPHHRHHPK